MISGCHQTTSLSELSLWLPVCPSDHLIGRPAVVMATDRDTYVRQVSVQLAWTVASGEGTFSEHPANQKVPNWP